MSTFTATERRALADKAGVDEQYLYQCLTGRNTGMAAREAVRVERATSFRLRRWHVRPKDWWLVWPELRKHKKAPPIPADAEAA